MGDDKLSVTDYLAIDRTNLANERTLLAYFRTFIILISSGFAIIKLDFLEEIGMLGVALLVLSPLVLALGLFRYYRMREKIKKHYYKNV